MENKMKTKQSMLTALKEKDREGLVRLVEQEGFTAEVDPATVLAEHSQRASNSFPIKSRALMRGGQPIAFFYEDLNDHEQEYRNGFVRQRDSDEHLEVIGYGVVEQIFDSIKNIKVELKHPRHFFWYDKTPMQGTQSDVERGYNYAIEEARELFDGGKINNRGAVRKVRKAAARRAWKMLTAEDEKDLMEMLRVNAFYAPGNPAEHYCATNEGSYCFQKMVPNKVPLGTVLAGMGGYGAYSLYSSGHPVWATAVAGLSYLLGKGPTAAAIEEFRDRFNHGHIKSSDRILKYDIVNSRSYRTGWYGRKAIEKVLGKE